MGIFLVSTTAMSNVSTRNASGSISENVFSIKQPSIEVIGQTAFESIVEIEKNDNNVSNWQDFSEAESEALLQELLIADDQGPECSLNKNEPFVFNTAKEDYLTTSRENAVSCQNFYIENEGASGKAKRIEATENKRNIAHNEKSSNPSDQVKQFPVNNISSSSISFNNVGEGTSTNAFHYLNATTKKEPLSVKAFVVRSALVSNEAESAVAKDQVQNTPVNKDKTVVYSTKEKDCLNSSVENVSPLAINIPNLIVKNKDSSKRPDITKLAGAIANERNTGHNVKSSNTSDQVKQFPVDNISSSSVSRTSVGEATSTNALQNIGIKKDTLSPSTFVGAEAESSVTKHQGIPINKDKTVAYCNKVKDCLNSSVENVSPVTINFQNLSVENEDTSKRPDGTKRTEAIEYERNTGHNVKSSNRSDELKQLSVNNVTSSFNTVEEGTSANAFQSEAESAVTKHQVQDTPINQDKTVVGSTKEKDCLNISGENVPLINFQNLFVKSEDTTKASDIMKQAEAIGIERNTGHSLKSSNRSDQLEQLPVNSISSSFKNLEESTSTNAFQYQNIDIKKEPLSTFVGAEAESAVAKVQDTPVNRGKTAVYSTKEKDCLNSSGENVPLVARNFQNLFVKNEDTSKTSHITKQAEATGIEKNTGHNLKSSNGSDQLEQLPVNNISSSFNSVEESTSTISFQYQNVDIKKEPLSPSTFVESEAESAVTKHQVQDTPINQDKTVVGSTKEKDCLNISGENVPLINFQNLFVKSEDTCKTSDITKQAEATGIERITGHKLKSLNPSDQLEQLPVNRISSSFNSLEESTSTNAFQYQNVDIKKEPLSPSTFVGSEAESAVAKDQVQNTSINEDKTVVGSTKGKDCLNSSGENVPLVTINCQNLFVKNEDTSKTSDITKQAEAIGIERSTEHNVKSSKTNDQVKQFPVDNISSSSVSLTNIATSSNILQCHNVAIKKDSLCTSPYVGAEAEYMITKNQVEEIHVNKDKTIVSTEGKDCLSNSGENLSPFSISYPDLCLKRKNASVCSVHPAFFEMTKTKRNIEQNDKFFNPSNQIFILGSKFPVNSEAREGNKLNNTNSIDCFNKFSFKDAPEQNPYHMEERQVSGDAELECASTANVVADKARQEENISEVIENSEKPAETPSNDVKASDFCYSNNLFEDTSAGTNDKLGASAFDNLGYDFSSVEKNTFFGYLFDVSEVLKAMEFLENKDHLAVKNLILQDRAVEKNLSETEEVVQHRRVNFNFEAKLKDDKHNLPSTELPTTHSNRLISTSNKCGFSLQPMAEYICDNLKQQALNDECLVGDGFCNKKADKRRASTGCTVEESSSKRLCLSTEKQNFVKENEYKSIRGNFSTFPSNDLIGVTNSNEDPMDKIPEVCSNKNIYGLIQNRESVKKGKDLVINSEVSSEELQNNKKNCVEGIDKDFLRKILKSVIPKESSESHQPMHSLASLSTTSVSSDYSKEIFSTPELKIDSEAALEVSDSNSIQKFSTTNIFSQNQVEPVQQLNQQPVQIITPVSVVPIHSYRSKGSSFVPISKASNADGISAVDSNSIQRSSLAINMFQSQGELDVKYCGKRKAELETSQEWKKSKALHNNSFDEESFREKPKYTSQNLSLALCHTFQHKAHSEPVSSATSIICSKNPYHNIASYILTPDSNINNDNKSSEVDFLSLAKWSLDDAKKFCGLVINSDFFNSSNPILAGNPATDIPENQDEQMEAVETTNELSIESIIINEKQRYNITTENILSYSVSSSSRSWDLICFIIMWKTDYFLDYDRSKKPPPITNKCCQVSNVYNSYRCYYETYLPLLLLETWENMYSAWRTVNTKKKRYVWKICAVEVKNRENVISITCDTVTSFSFSEINPKECGVMLLEFISSHKRILGYVHGTWSREYMPEFDKNHPCFQHHRYSDDKCLKRKVLIYIAHDNSRWIKKNDLLYISMLINITNVLVKNEALVDMRRAFLCNTILNPHSCDVKKFELPARHITDTRDRIDGLIKSLNLSTFCLTLVKTSPLCDSILAIVTMVNCIKAYGSKVLIIARSESALTEIAHNLNVVVHGHLIILAKEIKDKSLKQCMLDSFIDRSNDDSCQNFLNNCDILLTTLSACQTCDIKKILKHVNIKYCIMNETSMCTELECILPLLYNVPKMIFMGNPTEYQENSNGVSGIASNLGYYRSLFHRVW